MLERAGGLALGMVVDRPADGHPVFGVHRAGGHVGRNHLPSPPRYPHVRCSTDGDPRQAGGRQQAPGAAGVKAGQVYSPRGRHFPDKVPSDEVAGDDEKHVHADVAARDAGRPHMESQDQEDRDGAQGLDVGAEGGHGEGMGGATVCVCVCVCAFLQFVRFYNKCFIEMQARRPRAIRK